MNIDYLRKVMAKEVFTEEDLKLVFAGKTETAILSMLSRALRTKQIEKVKRGVYVFGDELRRHPISKFNLANKIYFPSYVSLESALAYHGLIPEAVYTTTSACQLRKKKKFATPYGDFSYDYIPCSPFFLGVESQKIGIASVLLANPFRALFDFLYVYRKTYKSVEDMEKDIRIDLDALEKHIEAFAYRELETLALSYRRKNIMEFFLTIARDMK
jgi:predicted transcriptional regulator of viral defense system